MTNPFSYFFFIKGQHANMNNVRTDTINVTRTRKYTSPVQEGKETRQMT